MTDFDLERTKSPRSTGNSGIPREGGGHTLPLLVTSRYVSAEKRSTWGPPYSRALYITNYAMNLCIEFDIICRTDAQNNKSDLVQFHNIKP